MANKQDLRIRTHKRPGTRPAREQTPPAEDTALREVPAKKRRRRGTVRRVLARLLVVAALFAAGFLIWQNWDKLAPDKVLVWLEETFAGRRGDGFPVEISGSGVTHMETLGENLALLTDTSFVIYSNQGGELTRRQHNYSAPLLKTAGDYALIAETGGTRFRLETRASTVLNVTADNKSEDEKETPVLDTALTGHPIISAAVGRSGTVALVTDSSQSYTSEVYVYDKKGKLLFHHNNSDLMAIDIAVSPNEKQVAIAGVAAHKGSIQSTVQVFSLRGGDNKPSKTYTGQDTLLCALSYFSNGRLAAVGDNAVWLLDPSGDLDKRVAYTEQQLDSYRIGDRSVGLVLSHYGSSDGGELRLITDAGEEAFAAAFTGTFRDMASVGNDMLLLTSNGLQRTNGKGLGKMMDVPPDGRMIAALGNKAIVLGLTALREFTP